MAILFSLLVIPGRREVVNPESRNNIWIPDRLAALGVRNDG
jgi:hypothetical protein